MGGPTPYSRESTPDSGASHYMDSYRDHSGKYFKLLSPINPFNSFNPFIPFTVNKYILINLPTLSGASYVHLHLVLSKLPPTLG